ncbi:MAG: hypothetical protein ACI8PT_004715 [Gammaproteobacteria bacterium]|jgi:hypothetical protein
MPTVGCTIEGQRQSFAPACKPGGCVAMDLLRDEGRLSGSGKAEGGADPVVVPASPTPASSTLADFLLGEAA